MTLPSLRGSSAAMRVVGIALLWLAAISVLHVTLNGDEKPSNRILMGYMPVITNLAAPLVDVATAGHAVHFEAVKFGSFAEIAEAFRSGHIQVAFIIAPLAIALHTQGVPLKIVYIGNRHESTLVVRKECPSESLAEMEGKTIAVPIRFSGHLLALNRYFRERGRSLHDALQIREIPPPDMPAALAAGAIDGYFVGEPFASKALQSGIGKRLVDVEAIWPQFICNLVIVRDELIQAHPDWVQTLVTGAVRSGFWAQSHETEAIDRVSTLWGQDPKVVSYAFANPPHRFRFDLFVPVAEELQEVAAEMRKAGLVQGEVDLTGLLDDRFARAVSPGPVESFKEIIP